MDDLRLIEPSLGPALRRWRLLHRVKQSHAAELFGVTQSTVSRWEAGIQRLEPAERAKVARVLAARLDTAADRMVGMLVNESPRAVHLICDLTHRLLACSSSREREFGVPLPQLLGKSLLRYATPEIVAQEERLDDIGWREAIAPPSLVLHSGANASREVPIRPGLCRWTRITLSDGTAARLVETLQ